MFDAHYTNMFLTDQADKMWWLDKLDEDELARYWKDYSQIISNIRKDERSRFLAEIIGKIKAVL